MERGQRRAGVAQVVADQAQRRPRVEPRRRRSQRFARPQAEAGVGQALPRKLHARVALALRREVAVGEDRLRRQAQPAGQIGQQAQQALDLRLGERFPAVVVELDADRRRIQIRHVAPAARAGVPGAPLFGHQLIDAPVLADQVMRADLALRVRRLQRAQGFAHAVHLGVVQHDQLRAPLVEVGRAAPLRQRIVRRRAGAAGQDERQRDGAERRKAAKVHAVFEAGKTQCRASAPASAAAPAGAVRRAYNCHLRRVR